MIYRGLEITKNKKEYLIYNGDMLLKLLPIQYYNIDDVYNYIDEQAKLERAKDEPQNN
jgi:hypothetical protein|tara:strand:+ start:890 stop:1063 length:174 start_codon:yes stop_codon:yes gene_type:complete